MPGSGLNVPLWILGSRLFGAQLTARLQASAMLTCSFVGSPETVRHSLNQFIEQTGVDELIVASAIYDHAARLRSYEILANLFQPIGNNRSMERPMDQWPTRCSAHWGIGSRPPRSSSFAEAFSGIGFRVASLDLMG